jgi:hypothetical protein
VAAAVLVVASPQLAHPPFVLDLEGTATERRERKRRRCRLSAM